MGLRPSELTVAFAVRRPGGGGAPRAGTLRQTNHPGGYDFFQFEKGWAGPRLCAVVAGVASLTRWREAAFRDCRLTL
jgi:hypothetical protein